MGDVVNSAAHLAHKAGRTWQAATWFGATFRLNLNDDNKGLLSSRWDSEIGGTVFIGDIVNIAMNDWIGENFTYSPGALVVSDDERGPCQEG